MESITNDVSSARLGLLALAWLGYFALHSLLASLSLKDWLAQRKPAWMRGYRLFFNGAALVLLLPVLTLLYSDRGPWLWQWTGVGWWAVNTLAMMAALGIIWSLRWYDGSEFLGLRQWRDQVRSTRDLERFQLSPLHRYVRHPWYSLGLVLVWTRDMDPAFLTTAVLITLYFTLGSRFEERKLILYHGELYRRYRRLVPSLIPLPWRYLSRAQARLLGAAEPRKRRD